MSTVLPSCSSAKAECPRKRMFMRDRAPWSGVFESSWASSRPTATPTSIARRVSSATSVRTASVRSCGSLHLRGVGDRGLVRAAEPAALGQRAVEDALQPGCGVGDDLLGVGEALGVAEAPPRPRRPARRCSADSIAPMRTRSVQLSGCERAPGAGRRACRPRRPRTRRSRWRRGPRAGISSSTSADDRGAEQVAVVVLVAAARHDVGDRPRAEHAQRGAVAAEGDRQRVDQPLQRRTAHAADDEQREHRPRAVAALQQPAVQPDRADGGELVPDVGVEEGRRRRAATAGGRGRPRARRRPR